MVRRRRPPATSWERVADWYRELSGRRGPDLVSRVLYPEVHRLLGSLRERRILDVGCGSGALARRLAAGGALVTGIDVSARRVEMARRDAKEAGIVPFPEFEVADPHDPDALQPRTFDAATLVLSLHQMERPEIVLRNVARALRPGGRLLLALNHPCFRVPGSTHWGWDPDEEVQFRRIDRYRSSHKLDLGPHTEGDPSDPRPSFHWPLERIFGALRAAGLVVLDLVEPVSDRVSEGRRTGTEDRARREIPLFLVLLARQHGPGAGRAPRKPPRSG